MTKKTAKNRLKAVYFVTPYGDFRGISGQNARNCHFSTVFDPLGARFGTPFSVLAKCVHIQGWPEKRTPDLETGVTKWGHKSGFFSGFYSKSCILRSGQLFGPGPNNSLGRGGVQKVVKKPDFTPKSGFSLCQTNRWGMAAPSHGWVPCHPWVLHLGPEIHQFWPKTAENTPILAENCRKHTNFG